MFHFLFNLKIFPLLQSAQTTTSGIPKMIVKDALLDKCQ